MEFWEKFVANAERHELKSMEFWRKFIADAERYQPENTESWQKFKADAERHHRENMEFHQKFVADAERHQPENTESWQKFKADAERHHRENMEFWKKFVADVNLDKTNTELRELAKEKLELEVDKNKQWFSTDKSPYDNLIKSLEARELELNQLKTIQIQKAESFQTPKPSSLLDDFPDEI
jgi:hydroxylamine reductase (hybrid-cluster protein)